jgi:hypothetical protein
VSPREPKKAKIGRNDPCPCGSGQKYKRCHGALGDAFSPIPSGPPLRAALQQKLEELKAIQIQREKQQGLGRPIISTEFRGYRLVAVGSTLYHSKAWKTFHDFLLDYIKFVLGSEWGNQELKKPDAERHPILNWYGLVCKYQAQTVTERGKVHSAPMIGVVSAYLGLAYNLYLLAHNATVQARLIKRLKDPKQFHGAYYEAYVAAAFVKAGFELELENEDDASRSHCEFTATYRATGTQFSVEAKSRLPGKATAKVGNQLYAALKKQALHTRVIFVDLNVPESVSDFESATQLKEALASVRAKEPGMTIDGQPAPPAYVFLTNHPFQYGLESITAPRMVLAEGFKIPDYKLDSTFATLREALKARERHIEMFELMRSLRVHYEIPSTFDGEIPEFTFHEHAPRLRIGGKYLVPTADGTERVGTLLDATVSEQDAIVWGIYRLEDGNSIVATSPLTDSEIAAYRSHPETFFGVPSRKGAKVKDLLGMFDWLYETYQHTPKEKLLEFMGERSDIESLRLKDQKQLAIDYCEAMAYAMMNSNLGMQRSHNSGVAAVVSR